MSKRISPQMPGEPVNAATEQPAEQPAPTVATAAIEPAVDQGPAPETQEPVVASAAPAPALGPAKQAMPANRSTSELPDQSEIDPYSIKRAVLSKQGWVCPARRDEDKRGR